MCSILSRSIFSVGRFLHKPSHLFVCKIKDIPKIILYKSYSIDDKSKKLSKHEIQQEDEKHNLAADVKPGYQIFRDEDADIIFDVDEEQKRLDLATINTLQQITDPYEGLNMKHGVNGVFDIEDLIEILRKDKAQNIFVAIVPFELSYVDYIVIVTGRSPKHISALATYVRKAYKLKRYHGELLPKIEGKKSNNWIALDLGNIALHIFSTEARDKYDLETLWSVGSNYDKMMNNAIHDTEFQDYYTDYLAEFQPANESEISSKSV